MCRHVRVFLAGENTNFIRAVSEFVATEPDIEVVGHAATGPDSVDKVRRLVPDVVIVDMAMPEMGGLEVVRRIKGQASSPRVIVLAFDNNQEYRAAARRAGADGLLAKSDVGTDLLPVIRRVYAQRDTGVE